jgi:hypothetical protein
MNLNALLCLKRKRVKKKRKQEERRTNRKKCTMTKRKTKKIYGRLQKNYKVEKKERKKVSRNEGETRRRQRI